MEVIGPNKDKAMESVGHDKDIVVEGLESDKDKQNKNSILPIKKDYSIQNGEKTDHDDEPLLDDLEEEGKKCYRCLRFLASLTIEPAMFFYMLSFTLSLSCMQNLLMDKGCFNYFNYTEEICKNITAYPREKENLEVLANNYSLYSNLMSFISAGVMIFIAPWSDKYGRKLPLTLACVGAILTDVGIVMCVLYFDSSLVLLVVMRLPLELTGGFICFLTIVYSHAADVSTVKNRTLKYTTIEIAFMLGFSVGGMAGGYIFQYFGYFYVYVAGTALHVLSAIWITFFFDETSGDSMESSWTTKRRNFFRLDSISRSWVATVRHREDKGRTKMVMYFISMGVVILTYEVFGGLGYLYAHHIYNWNPTTYNTVNTISMASCFIVMAMLTPIFLKVLKLSDAVLGLLGTISTMAKFTLLAFAKYNVSLYYLGNAAGFLSAFTPLAVRAEISKIANKEEIVLVFSFLATCEALFPMVGSALCTKVFNATMDIFPSVAYLMAVGFLFIPLLTFIWVFIRSRRN